MSSTNLAQNIIIKIQESKGKIEHLDENEIKFILSGINFYQNSINQRQKRSSPLSKPGKRKSSFLNIIKKHSKIHTQNAKIGIPGEFCRCCGKAK